MKEYIYGSLFGIKKVWRNEKPIGLFFGEYPFSIEDKKQ